MDKVTQIKPHRNTVDLAELLAKLALIHYYGELTITFTGGIPQAARLDRQTVRLGIPEFQDSIMLIEVKGEG